MSDNEDSIVIFSIEETTLPAAEARRGLESALKSATTKASAVTVGILQENLCHFLSGLDTILNGSPKEVGGLTLDEVEIHAQIDGKGNVGLSGVAGFELAAQSGIKLVLRKRA
jgi:hypothetical protein